MPFVLKDNNRFLHRSRHGVQFCSCLLCCDCRCLVLGVRELSLSLCMCFVVIALAFVNCLSLCMRFVVINIVGAWFSVFMNCLSLCMCWHGSLQFENDLVSVNKFVEVNILKCSC